MPALLWIIYTPVILSGPVIQGSPVILSSPVIQGSPWHSEYPPVILSEAKDPFPDSSPGSE